MWETSNIVLLYKTITLEFIEFKFPKINVWIVVFVMMVSILTDFVIEILQLLTNGYNSTYQ